MTKIGLVGSDGAVAEGLVSPGSVPSEGLVSPGTDITCDSFSSDSTQSTQLFAEQLSKPSRTTRPAKFFTAGLSSAKAPPLPLKQAHLDGPRS